MIHRHVAALQKRLPPGAKLEIVQDAGTRVHHAVRNVQEALIEGALLTVLVVFLFLNSWRSTVITGLALPVSVLASFVAVWAFGFTLNTMSLMGLSLAIGILIDDAIVVRENIVRHIEMGKDHYEASREGTDEIGLAVAATTFSIVAVFVPVGFMYGISGQWFKPFALTIACSVLVSLFVSFSLDPMLSAYWADPQTEAHERRNSVARTLDRFNKWFDRMADRYKDLIAWALDHRLMMVGLALATFVAALTIPAKGALAALVMLVGLFAVFWILQKPLLGRLGVIRGTGIKLVGIFAVLAVTGFLLSSVPVIGQVGAGFVPVSDRSEISMIVEAPPGSNLEYTRLKAEEAARRAREHPEVRLHLHHGGHAGAAQDAVGGPGAGLREAGAQEGARRQPGGAGRDVPERDEADRRRAGLGVHQRLRRRHEVHPGPDEGRGRPDPHHAGAAGGGAGGEDPGRGGRRALDARPEAGAGGPAEPRASPARSASPWDRWPSRSGRPSPASTRATGWIPRVRRATSPCGWRRRRGERVTDLAQLPLVAGTGTDGVPSTLPLGQVATIRQGLGPAQIDHLDRDKVVIIQANVAGRPLTQVTQDITARLAQFNLPPGYEITYGGESQDQAEVFTRIFTALGVAVLLMYLILVVQFGSFLDPLAILVSLPLSLIGVVLALWVTGDTLNIMSLIGVILLMGIVAKNAILLIDFAKWARERGTPLREALIEAGRIRLRPIIMTTLALIAGMIPVAHRERRRRRLPGAAGPGRHRRHHHVHAADAAGDPDGLRDPGRDALVAAGEVRPPRRAAAGSAGAALAEDGASELSAISYPLSARQPQPVAHCLLS